jgi:hypothetical protein
MEDMNMTSLSSDPCEFQRQNLIVSVYVDDIVITGEDHEIDAFKDVLSTKFECKDLGPCRYLLGLEITQTNESIVISQSGYAQRILKRFHIIDCKGRDTPLDAGTSSHAHPLMMNGSSH